MQTRTDLTVWFRKVFGLKPKAQHTDKLPDYEKMDPDDILWLMQPKRKRRSCEQPASRNRYGELLLWGAAGTGTMLPALCQNQQYAESRCCRLVLWQHCCVIQQLLISDNFSWELSQKHFSKWLVLVTASALISL